MKDFFYKFFHGLLFLIFIDLAGTGFWAWGVVHTFEGHVPKAPIAAVLISDFDEETGELGDETLRRLDHALGLYQEGTVGYILCVGGARPRFKMFGSEYMRDFLIDEGLPEDKVFLERKSYDTRTNWRMTHQTVKGFGWDKVVVVSSPFHLYRFRQLIKIDPQKGLNVFVSPYSLKHAWPRITLVDIWVQTHYEWLAHFSQLLPEKTYNELIKEMRGQ